VPIFDQFGKVIGACQAINKISNKQFDSDDEWLLENLTHNAGIILRNAMQFDESVLLQHHFK
jgi:GAF domain-containing protein